MLSANNLTGALTHVFVTMYMPIQATW